jgi:hypothetical protein
MDAVTPERKRRSETMRESLFCVARGRNGAWEAFCLDLDLAVQGNSFDDVKNQIERAVVGYVESALMEAEPTRSQLLNRRAPFFVRLTWGVRFFLAAVLRRSREHDATVGFPVSCPA